MNEPTIKVVAVQSVAGPKVELYPDKVYEVDKAKANEWIKHGWVKPVEQAERKQKREKRG